MKKTAKSKKTAGKNTKTKSAKKPAPKASKKKIAKKPSSKKSVKKTTRKNSKTISSEKSAGKKSPGLSKKELKLMEILEKASEKINPSDELMKKHSKILGNFIKKINSRIAKSKIDAEVFVGGSFAKKTVIRKENYDADVFIRFSPGHKRDDLSKRTKKLLKGFNKERVHGSRDYYIIKPSKSFKIEVVPVLKVYNPEKAENVTDLSYSHVNYINKKTNPKLLKEIKLAKAFCEANRCYGAESYINGFSGYALELLVIHYGNFLNFLKDMIKVKKENKNIVIDIERYFRNEKEVSLELNSSKLQSPVILIDPTYKKRNALAALSEETLEKFVKAAESFLNSPDLSYFEKKKIDIKEIKRQALKERKNFILIEATTKKQSGDIAGSKLSKFHKHLTEEVSEYFEIHNKGFNYGGDKSAKFFFVLKPKKEIIFMGPQVGDKENAKKFKKQHKNVLQKGGRFYAIEKINFTPRGFIKRWKKKNKRKMKEMSIKKLRVFE